MSALRVVAELSASRLLNSVVEGFAVALLAWMLLRVFGRQNSGTRFAIWFSALVAIAALPLVGTSWLAAPTARPEIAIGSSWAVYIFGAWTSIALIALTRVAVGLWRVRGLRASCTPIAQPFTKNDTKEDKNLTTGVTQGHRGTREVCVCVSERVQVPTAVGFFRPMVILPPWTVEELSREELNAVVLHEMAHLRRWDDWSNLTQKVIRALLFFHPAVWWIDNRLTLEREMACDDLVLAETSNPRAYAECLVSLAEKNFLRRGLAMAQAAVGRIKHMSLRVARILDHPGSGTRRGWRPAVALLGVLSTASVVAVTRSAPLVGFDDNAAPVTAASAEIHVPTSMVVQAGLHRSDPVHFTKAVIHRPSAVAQHGNEAQHLAALGTQEVRRRPQVVPARAKQAQVPQPTFVLIEAEYYESAQGVFWTMTVWHVDVSSPQQKQASGVNPRSI